jgi:hypothetical protein
VIRSGGGHDGPRRPPLSKDSILTVHLPRRTLTALLVAALAIPLTPDVATAEPGRATLTWTVQPAAAGGPDGRRWIERDLEPGAVVTEHLAVRNLSDASAVFALSAADGYLTDKGRFNMLASDQPSKDGGTWIAVQKTVTVAANETKVVPFTITVPRNATPGDHPAGIAASIVSGTGTVQLESRVGFRVLLRAGGALRPALSADHVRVRYERSWNPLRSGTIHVTYAAANTGNVRVEARGRAEVAELFGAHVRCRDVGGEELLPGGNHTTDVRIGGVWAAGRLRTTLTLTPSILGTTGTSTVAAPTTVTVTTWALPWAQLVLTAAVVALALALRTAVRLRRRRITRMLELAREEGRRSAG